MSSWSPDVVRETAVHNSAVPIIASTDLRSKNCASEKELGRTFGGNNIDERTMRDGRDVEPCLETILLPTTTKAAIEAEEDMLAAAINSAQLFADHETSDDELSVNDNEARRRFLCQPWSFLRDCLERSKSDCDTGTDERGAKTKEQRKLAVLPHAKYPVYGYCPSRDDFVVVKCKLCGMAVKPVAHRAHMHLRHNIGLKSPEPTTPVASVISPPFPSTSSTTIEAPKSCSNAESITAAQYMVETAATGEKELSKEVRKTSAVAKSSTTDSAAPSSKETAPSAAGSYVVAPHSADRPLKLTFRRARSNASHAPSSSTAVSSSGGQSKDRKKPLIASVAPLPSSTTRDAVKSRLRQPNVGNGATPSSERVQQSRQQQQTLLLPATTSTAMSNEKAETWNHHVTPSTSSANVESTGLVGVPSTLAPAPASTIPFATPIIMNASSFQNQVYEHPKPLAVSRLEQVAPHQFEAPPQSSLNMDYSDHTCYFLSLGAYNQKKWPMFRRPTQSIRQACRKVFVGESGEEDSFSCRQGLSALVLANGSRERPKVVEADVNKWILNRGGGQKRRIFNSDQTASSRVAILRRAGINNRMVRVTSAVKNGSTDYHQPAASVVVPGGKFSAASAVASSMPNKSYTKVSINQLKAAAIESGTAQLPLDLGSLMCNGDSTFQYKPAPATIASVPTKPVVNQKRTAVKRPSSSNVLPSPLMTTLGSEMQMGPKKPRMFQNNGRAVVDVEELDSAGMGGSVISNLGLKPAGAPSLNHAQARQQLVKALQHAHNPNNGNRRRPPPSHAIRHQLTPIVISPSQTPQAASPLQQPQPQPQQQQVVLVSVNGPAVLTGWHKLTTTAGAAVSQQQQTQTGLFQNGLATTATTALDSSASIGTRVIRPKLSSASASLPVFVTEQGQAHQPYRQSQSLLAQKLAAPVSNGGALGGYAVKQAAQSRFCRRANSAVAALDDVSAYSLAQQQQPLTHFRPIQPAQQLTFGHGGGGTLRTTASTPVLAGQFVLNVTTVSKGGPTVNVAPTSTVSVGAFIGQQVPRQSSTPSGATSNVSAPLNFLAASSTGYGATSNATAATTGIYSS